jgi:hypothetical protein
MSALLDLIAGSERLLSIPTKLTAQRRSFLMSMILSEQGTAVQARREIHRALTAAQGASDHMTILRLRNLQRERDAAQLRKVERMRALRIIIDRKQREREEEEAASAAGPQGSRPSTGASSVLTPSISSTRPGTNVAAEDAAAEAALWDLRAASTSSNARGGAFAHLGVEVGGEAASSDNRMPQGKTHSISVSPSLRLQGGQSAAAAAADKRRMKLDNRVGALQCIEAEQQAKATTEAVETKTHGVDRRHASGAVGSHAAADAAWELEQALTGGSAAARRRATAAAPGSFSALAAAHTTGQADTAHSRAQRNNARYAVRVPIEGWVEGGKMADMARVLAGRMV